MNPKTFLKRTTSFLVGLALAVAGSLVATQPANASEVANDPALSGNAYPGGSLDFAEPITWDVIPTQVQYLLLICDTARSTGTKHEELFWTDMGQVGNTHCASFKNGQNPVVYTSLPITLPTGISSINISNGSYLAIAVQTDLNLGAGAHNFVSKTLGTTWSTQAPSSITGTPTVTSANGVVTASMATSSGSNVYNNWYACSSEIVSAVNSPTGSVSLQGCAKIYQSQGMGYGQVLSNSIQLAGSYFEQGGPNGYSALSLSGKHLVFVQYISGGSGGYAYSASVSVGTLNQGSSGITTCVINGVTQTGITAVESIVATLTPSNSYRFYFNGDSSLSNCMFPVSPGFGAISLLNGVQIGTASYTSTSGLGYGPTNTTRTLAQLLASATFSGVTVADGDIYTVRYFTGISQAPTINSTGYVSVSMTLMPGVDSSSISESVSRSVERVIEVPKFQGPIFEAVAPKIASGFSSTGGRLVLKDLKPTDITGVTLNGKPVTVIASKSGSALKIPAGSAAGDLIFTMADGSTITVPNAVKIVPSQVDEKLVDLKNLPKFSGTSVKVPTAVAAAITKQKSLIADSTSAKCVGYASANTATARATALARATNVCGVITNINESIEPIIKVVVNKTIAKKSAVRYLTW